LNIQILCEEPEGVMDQEGLFLKRLDHVTYYRIVRDDQNQELLEMYMTVWENNQLTEKVLLVFYDQQDGPPQR
jgi:hypothetical protein